MKYASSVQVNAAGNRAAAVPNAKRASTAINGGPQLTGIAAAANGRERLLGCRRSASISARSLSRYTAEAQALKAANAIEVCSNASGSSTRCDVMSGTKTSRF